MSPRPGFQVAAQPDMLAVVAAVVRGAAGQVLIARRADHLHQGGRWEFPGGKLEAGETSREALDRELDEELGIRPAACRRLLRIPYRYPDKAVLLDVWEVSAFTGTPAGRQGQPLAWAAPEDLARYRFPAANRPILAAARLPEHYLITPPPGGPRDAAWPAGVEQAAAAGRALIQLRAPALAPEAFAPLAREACRRAQAHGARVLVNGPPELARAAGADGLHLSSARLAMFQREAATASLWVGASCHGPEELARAVHGGADFAVLSPVAATPSHPQAEALGWRRFAAWVRDLPLPVYALGGLGPADLEAAHAARAQGVAGIRGFWPGDKES